MRRGNGRRYGLGASVWGSDPVQLRSVASQLEAGTVWINQHAIRNPFVPATAYKDSGLAVEFGPEGLAEFCNMQVIAAKERSQYSTRFRVRWSTIGPTPAAIQKHELNKERKKGIQRGNW